MKIRTQLLVAAGLLAGCAGLRAQFVWTGSSSVNGSLSDPNNWQAHTPAVPVGDGTEDLDFGDPTGGQINPLVATSAFNNLVFNGSVRPQYTFSGTGATPVMTLNGTITVGVGGPVTFDNTLGLSLSSGTHNIDIAGSNLLTINGNITGAGGINLTDTGFVVLAGTNTYSGGTTVDHGGSLAISGSVTTTGADTIVGTSSGTGGTLGIALGGHLTDNQGQIGVNGTSTLASVLVDGAGSTWTNATNLYVGELGSAALSITNGGLVTSQSTSIGNNAGGTGIVTVDGAGSTLANTGILYVGAAGDGSLDISNGGHATSSAGSIGNNPGGNGFASIDGVGSSWINSGDLVIGDGSGGYLGITGGATVTNANGYVAMVSGVVGQALLQNTGSTWNVTNALYLGYSGSGSMVLADNAVLNVANGNGTIFLGYNSGSAGQFTIGLGGQNGGIVNAASITTMNGSGTVVFEDDTTSASPYYLTKDGTSSGTPVTIGGSTSVMVFGGYNVLAGANTYTGGTTINSGTIVAASNTALGTGPVVFGTFQSTLNVASGVTVGNPLNVTNGGTFAGNGTIGSLLIAGHGVSLSPGDTIGALNFSNGLNLASTGGFIFQVQTANGVAGTGYDTVNVTGGTLSVIGSPLTILVQSLDGTGNPGAVSDFLPTATYSWTLFNAPGGISGFSPSEFQIDATGFTNSLGTGSFFVVQSGNQIQLDFAPVPEPSAYALFASGLAVVGWTLRRRLRPAGAR